MKSRNSWLGSIIAKRRDARWLARRSQVGDPPVAPASFEAREPAAERVKRHDNRDPGDINPKEADTETFRRRSAGGESRHLPQAEAARQFERHGRAKSGVKVQDIEKQRRLTENGEDSPEAPPSRSSTGNSMTAGPKVTSA